MKNFLLKIKRGYWKFKLSSLESDIIWRYCLQFKKYQILMIRLNFCKKIAMDYSLEKFSEQFHVMKQVYKSTIRRMK
jgi:hypothetical protein